MIVESQAYRHSLKRPSKRERSNSISTTPIASKKLAVNPPPIPVTPHRPPPPPPPTNVTPSNNPKSPLSPITSPNIKPQQNFVPLISTPPVNARKESFDSN